jgi:hypothetical protein
LPFRTGVYFSRIFFIDFRKEKTTAPSRAKKFTKVQRWVLLAEEEEDRARRRQNASNLVFDLIRTDKSAAESPEERFKSKMGNSQAGNTLRKEELDKLNEQTHCIVAPFLFRSHVRLLIN